MATATVFSFLAYFITVSSQPFSAGPFVIRPRNEVECRLSTGLRPILDATPLAFVAHYEHFSDTLLYHISENTAACPQT